MNFMRSTPKNKKRRGFVTIYVVFTSLLLIPVVGLAIDFSVLYNVKARLQTSVDAAVIAAGNTLQSTTNISDQTQIDAVKATAVTFFNANYPSSYWGSTPAAALNPTVGLGASNSWQVSLTATEYVPLLFLRVLGLSQSTVAATAQSSVRFLNMMIVVDRSGSVQRGGNVSTIANALTQFIGTAGTSPFVDGRDTIGLGSFGSVWHTDLAPTTHFRAGGATSAIQAAINSIPYGNSPTNTAEGLHQAYTLLKGLNQSGALNVIVLLTDGRPSAFTASLNAQGTCTTTGNRTAVVTALVGTDSTWPPPQVDGGAQGPGSAIWTLGLFNTSWVGLSGGPYANSDMQYLQPLTANAGCTYYTTNNPTKVTIDVTSFPGADIYNNSLLGPVYTGEGQSMSDPRAVRYASFNAADNQATAIRTDTTLQPILFVIGLNEPPSAGEPLDADWLARVANDIYYKDANGNSVYQSGQTQGKYYNVNGAGLGAAFQDVASQILRLSQ